MPVHGARRRRPVLGAAAVAGAGSGHVPSEDQPSREEEHLVAAKGRDGGGRVRAWLASTPESVRAEAALVTSHLARCGASTAG
jgi:hypothetical protein